MLTLAVKDPFKGTKAINLIRKIIQGELWNFFVETGATADSGTHDLSYFLYKIVNCYLMLDNPNRVMHDLLAMRLNNADDVKTFTTKFKATFDKRMDDVSSLSIALSLISREMFKLEASPIPLSNVALKFVIKVGTSSALLKCVASKTGIITSGLSNIK